MEKKTLENAMNDLNKYSKGLIRGMIDAAYSSIHDYIFDRYSPISESYEELKARTNAQFKAYKECSIALRETQEALEDISAVLYRADECEEISIEESDAFMDAGYEADELVKWIDEALDYIDQAKEAYDKLYDAMAGLDYMTK